MPANVGEMFYYGEVPWHGEGRKVTNPLNVDEAIRAGGLDWEVGTIPLVTGEYPPSPVTSRMAIVRKDRPPGEPGRVVGVAHRGFVPMQNRNGALTNYQTSLNPAQRAGMAVWGGTTVA